MSHGDLDLPHEQFGLPVKVGVPDEERALMNLYPQPRRQQDSAEAFPEAPIVPGLPPGREAPARSPGGSGGAALRALK